MKKLPALVGAAALVGGMAAGCSNSASSTNASASKAPQKNCSLATAPDPGNATAPADTPVASNGVKIPMKSTYTVAFSQNASNNPWRLAETASMKDEAKKNGDRLTVTDANNSQAQQVQDIKSLIAQHPDVLFIAPITEQIANVVTQARQAGLPVFLLDRDVTHSVAKPGSAYISVLQSDFVQEGKRAAVQMAHATGGKAKIIELEGTTGASPAIDRKKGFDSAITACPDMKIIASQDGDFTRAKGQQVMETLLQSHPDVTAVYAHNDEMALGAIAAIKAAGKKPGKDIQVVSIDGERDGLKAVQAGELYATVECNPRFGPKAFETMQAYAKGTPTKTLIINSDQLFTKSNVAQHIAAAY